MPRPMPRDAPVTSATRPSSPRSMRGSLTGRTDLNRMTRTGDGDARGCGLSLANLIGYPPSDVESRVLAVPTAGSGGTNGGHVWPRGRIAATLPRSALSGASPSAHLVGAWKGERQGAWNRRWRAPSRTGVGAHAAEPDASAVGGRADRRITAERGHGGVGRPRQRDGERVE